MTGGPCLSRPPVMRDIAWKYLCKTVPLSLLGGTTVAGTLYYYYGYRKKQRYQLFMKTLTPENCLEREKRFTERNLLQSVRQIENDTRPWR